MQIRRRELLGLFGLGLVGCSAGSQIGPGATAETGSTTTQPPDARRDARGDARRRTPNETAGGSATQAPSTTEEPTVKVIEVIGREGWGALEVGQGMVKHRIERLTIHHTGVELEDNRQAPSRLRAHQEFHQRDRGWPDLAYHFAIDREGNIYEGRSTDFRGDTATSYDPTGHLLAVLEGNFDVETPADPQIQSLAELLAWAGDRYSVGLDTIGSHRDYAPGETACPGANLYALLDSGAIAEMVDAVHERGTPEMVYLRGARAVERIATIESPDS